MSSKEISDSEQPDSVSAEAQENQDKDLDDLLEDALEDFNKPVVSASCPNQDKVDNAEAHWCNEFLGTAPNAFEEAVRSFISEDPEIAEGVKKFAEIANKAANGDVTDEEINSLTQTFLTNLSTDGNTSSENLSSLSEDLSKMFENLKPSDLPAPGEGDALPEVTSLMQNMMQMLISKDLLYPALKDIAEKYPDWLSEKRASLEPEVHEKYNAQFLAIKSICNEFEAEAVADTEDTKRARYERILELLQKMQECGQPPSDLIGDLGSAAECDENGLPNLPGLTIPPNMGENCNVM